MVEVLVGRRSREHYRVERFTFVGKRQRGDGVVELCEMSERPGLTAENDGRPPPGCGGVCGLLECLRRERGQCGRARWVILAGERRR